MPSLEFIKSLGIDAELIQRDREMSAGLAQAHQNRSYSADTEDERFLHRMAAATEFRRAAAHSVLFSDREAATAQFRQAAQSYCAGANPYGLLMFVCAGENPRNLSGLAREFGFSEGRVSDRLQLAYLLLTGVAGGWDPEARGVSDSQPRGKYSELLGGSLSSPIGVLALPVGAYIDLAFAVQSREPEIIIRALVPFLVAHSNALARASENRYHWQGLAMPFHPAEPDILSVAFVAEAVMREQNQSLFPGVLRRLPLLPASATLLSHAIVERFGESLAL